jgi:hypothetical protein
MLKIDVFSAFLLVLADTGYMQIQLLSPGELLTAVATLIALAMYLTHMFSQL